MLLNKFRGRSLRLRNPSVRGNFVRRAITNASRPAPALRQPPRLPQSSADAALAAQSADARQRDHHQRRESVRPEGLWEQGDIVAKTTLTILFIMSLGSWYIIFTKLYEQAKIRRQGNEADKSFWSAGTVRQGADALKDSSPYRFIAEQGLEATKKHDGLLGQIDLNSWIAMSIQRATDNVQSRLQDGLAFLATVGSTAPFVGLFGTVWGNLQRACEDRRVGPGLDRQGRGSVGEALIMTAIGLAVAVPAVLGLQLAGPSQQIHARARSRLRQRHSRRPSCAIPTAKVVSWP
jgi:biopolymer transport protein ExbB